MIEELLEGLGLIGNTIVLVIALSLIGKFSNIAVDNAVKLSEVTGIGKTTIGFLLIATFTTLPELSVSIFSGPNPKTLDIAIGNALGSNIVNVGIILGLCFILVSIINRRTIHSLSNITSEEIRRLYFGLLTASIVPLALYYMGYVGKMVGAILIALYIYNAFRFTRIKRTEEEENTRSESSGKYALLAVAGTLGVVFCAYLIVNSGSYIATELGVPRVVIGATLVAFGTSLPEFVNGINAVRKGHVELTLGNIAGSNFINMTLVLGVASILSAVQVKMALYSTLVTFSVVASLLLWYILSHGKIGWREGLALLIMYTLFMLMGAGAYQV